MIAAWREGLTEGGEDSREGGRSCATEARRGVCEWAMSVVKGLQSGRVGKGARGEGDRRCTEECTIEAR